MGLLQKVALISWALFLCGIIIMKDNIYGIRYIRMSAQSSLLIAMDLAPSDSPALASGQSPPQLKLETSFDNIFIL